MAKFRVKIEASIEVESETQTQAKIRAIELIHLNHCTAIPVDNPNQRELFHSCQAQRVNDEMICGPCGLTWPVDDPEPPQCQRVRG